MTIQELREKRAKAWDTARDFLDSMITLAETKNYLRVDHTEDDKLILSLIDTAKRLVQDVGRMDDAALAVNEETTRQAMLYTVSYLYENRNGADYHKLTLMLRALLFAQREGVI